MKKIILVSVMMLSAITSFGREHVSATATVVADTIFYAENLKNVQSIEQASYYRLLKTQGMGVNKKDVFQDFYTNGTLKAEGGYSYVDLGNDKNTILNGDVTTYYKNGKEKWHGRFVNGKREGYFTLQMRDGGVATIEFVNGNSRYDYFVVTSPEGDMQKRPVSEIKHLLN